MIAWHTSRENYFFRVNVAIDEHQRSVAGTVEPSFNGGSQLPVTLLSRLERIRSGIEKRGSMLRGTGIGPMSSIRNLRNCFTYQNKSPRPNGQLEMLLVNDGLVYTGKPTGEPSRNRSLSRTPKRQ
jgi:hypothetical protein